MSANKIATRYAKSLLDLSLEQGKLDTVIQDIQAFDEAVEQRDFYLLLKSPIVNTEKKVTILKEIFEGKFDKITMSFINLITKKKREMYLPEIADAFISMYRKHKKISKVVIKTAVPLGTSELNQIKSKLLESNAVEQNLEVETVVDESIIGGFVIEIGDRLYDASVKHKLDEIKKQFSSNEFAAKI